MGALSPRPTITAGKCANPSPLMLLLLLAPLSYSLHKQSKLIFPSKVRDDGVGETKTLRVTVCRGNGMLLCVYWLPVAVVTTTGYAIPKLLSDYQTSS